MKKLLNEIIDLLREDKYWYACYTSPLKWVNIYINKWSLRIEEWNDFVSFSLIEIITWNIKSFKTNLSLPISEFVGNEEVLEGFLQWILQKIEIEEFQTEWDESSDIQEDE